MAKAKASAGTTKPKAPKKAAPLTGKGLTPNQVRMLAALVACGGTGTRKHCVALTSIRKGYARLMGAVTKGGVGTVHCAPNTLVGAGLLAYNGAGSYTVTAKGKAVPGVTAQAQAYAPAAKKLA